MKHRRIAALIALVALAFSFVETARAAVCEPAAVAAASGTSHGTPAHSNGADPTDHDPTSECPLGTAFQIGCAPSVSLPSSAAPELSIAAVGQVVTDVAAVIPRALQANPIFHPPRS